MSSGSSASFRQPKARSLISSSGSSLHIGGGGALRNYWHAWLLLDTLLQLGAHSRQGCTLTWHESWESVSTNSQFDQAGPVGFETLVCNSDSREVSSYSYFKKYLVRVEQLNILLNTCQQGSQTVQQVEKLVLLHERWWERRSEARGNKLGWACVSNSEFVFRLFARMCVG